MTLIVRGEVARVGLFPLLLVSLLFAGGCARDEESEGPENRTSSQQSVTEFPLFKGSNLEVGREIWLANCRACHERGVAGAPVVSNSEAWRSRIAQQRELLYQHAIEGFFGPMGTQMPPRGGNPDLSDEEVRAAVDYMVALVEQL